MTVRTHKREPEPPTWRQLLIAELAAKGLSNRAIAIRMELSLPVVGSQMRALFRKAGVRDRAGLGVWWRERPISSSDQVKP